MNIPFFIGGDVQEKITDQKPKLLQRLYKIKDAINRLEEQNGLKA